MLSQDEINEQQTLLETHRQRLSPLLKQQAALGTYTPPYVINEIANARTSIRQIKQHLRDSGVSVEDQLNDNDSPILDDTHLVTTGTIVAQRRPVSRFRVLLYLGAVLFIIIMAAAAFRF